VRRPSRTWRRLTKIALAASLLGLMAWAQSCIWCVERRSPGWIAAVEHGRLAITWPGGILNEPSWYVGPSSGSMTRDLGLHGPLVLRYSIFTTVRLPFWPVVAAAAGGTLWLWWRSRPYPPGCCRVCGYDLTGNVSGRCPECGTAVPGGERRGRGR